MCNLRIAVNERVKKGEDWEDHTEWFTVVVFGKTAENAAKYLAKGRQVFAEGASRFREYQKADGSTGYSREIVCGPTGLTFLGGKDGGGGGGGGNSGGGSRGSRPSQKEQNADGFYDDGKPSGGDVFDDDLPF